MIYRFLDHELDTDQHELRCAGKPVRLSPKPFAVLEYLVQNSGRMVPKSELLDTFWPSNVSEAALQTTIRAIRKSLGKGAGTAAIKTHHGHGFRFVAPLAVAEETSGAQTRTIEPVRLCELRLVTVVFMHIRAEPAPTKELEALLSQARDRIHAVDGRLQRVMIDGLIAVFGLGNHADDGARRAVTCAWDLLSSPEVAAVDGAVSFGIDCGQVPLPDEAETVAWTLPSAIERSAVQLAQPAHSGSIILGDEALSQLRDEVVCERTEDGHILVAPPIDRAGIGPPPPARMFPFVGRDRELAFLAASAAAATAGKGMAAILSGNAGIGKSRLVCEFLTRVDRERVSHAIVHCLPRMSNTPLAVVRQTLLAIGTHDAEDALDDEIDRALYRRIVDPSAPASPALDSLSEHVIRQRSRALAIDLIRAHCLAKPMVLAVEDAHWMDLGSRVFFARLIDVVDAFPLLLLLTSRPTEHAALTDAVLNLPPLGQRDCKTLLCGLAGARNMGDAALETLAERSAGNPFFLEELALALRAGRDPATELPVSVQAVIETRISSLAQELRTLLYAIAIIGPPAPLELISSLVVRDSSIVEISLAQLTDMGFLTAEEDGVQFRHMLMHDAAYAMISRNDRARLHGEVARLLEDGASHPLPETLALHWQEAGETDRAVAYWTKASNAALYRAAGRAAIVFANKGLDLIESGRSNSAQQEQGLQLSLATALMTRLGYGADEVGQAYYRALELSDETGSMKSRLRALLGLWVHTWVAGRLSESLSHGNALLALAEEVDDPALRLQGHGGIGSVLFHCGDLSSAQRHLEAGVALISETLPDKVSAQNAAVTCVAYCAWVASLQGRTDDMLEYVAYCTKLSERISNPFSVAIQQSLCSDVLQCAGDVDGCAGLAEKAVSVSRTHRYPFWLGTGLVMHGWALAREGKTARALEVVEEGISVFASTGARIQRANWFGIQAEVMLLSGRSEDGTKAVAKALECAHATGDSWYLPRVHAVASRLHSRLGNPRAAAAHANELRQMATSRRLASSFLTVHDSLP